MPHLGDIVDGKYRLQRLLGEGGMGSVFEAVNEKISKPCAIKFLRPELATDQRSLNRFLQEAQVAAIGHPAIVDIYDIGTADNGEMFLVMELLEGQTLRDLLIRKRRIERAMTAFIACQVLSALSKAHGQKIIHRDLKPENIFLVETRRELPKIKVLDFGISKIIDLEATLKGATTTGTVLGTPLYMSPEQASGERDLDGRADIYSIGVILYECLSGRVPFKGENYNEIVINVLTKPYAPLSEVLPDIDPELESVVHIALARDRENRYSSVESMLDDLSPFVREEDRPSIIPPLPPSEHHQKDEVFQLEDRPQKQSRKSGRTGAIVLGAFLIVMSLGAFFLFTFWDRGSGPLTPNGSGNAKAPVVLPSKMEEMEQNQVTEPEKAQKNGENIELRISVSPREARIFVDDIEVFKNPFVGRFLRDQASHTLKAQALGYKTWEETVVFQRDRSITIALERSVEDQASQTQKKQTPRGKVAPETDPTETNPWND